jgi:hypothetical protein
MKTHITRITLLSAAAILAGCIVTSVSPYYTQKDLVKEPALLGRWTNVNKPEETWTLDQPTNFAMRLTIAESSKTMVVETHAFRLRGQLFLDIFSLEQDYHVIPPHYVLKLDQLTPVIKASELDDAWLKPLLKNNPATIRHEFIQDGDDPANARVVLTASTLELQSFIVRNLKTPGAWKDGIELRKDSTTVITAEAKGRW